MKNSTSKATIKATAQKQKVAVMLEKETKKMEEKLELVKKMMELERDKRS